MSAKKSEVGAEGLGTFLGVYTPSILTILGVVLFLRTGWVVGNVGLLPALLIVVLAHVITATTALSVSAIATNMRVGSGGAYYLISRSLGLEIGGAIGVPLFLAQTFSVTLYAFGFAEGVQLLWPEAPAVAIAAATVVAVSAVSAAGPDLALKMQLPIMTAVGLALVVLVVGVARSPTASVPLLAEDGPSEPFWVVFAVFFPAVTGLLSGVSMSGDLADPKRSIPLGTILAVLTGFFVYMAVPVVLSVGAPLDELRADNMIWFRLAWLPLLIWPGFLGAILSSAMGSILGAPRTLAALAADRVVPRLPRWRVGRRRLDLPLVVSTAVALGAVGLGDLNAVAPVLTMFFLTTYGVVNLVAGLEELSGAPSYRPSIRVPWWLSLASAVACAWVMMLINVAAALVAILVEILLYMMLRRRSFSTSFGDLRYGALVSLARASLMRLRSLPMDPRNWRPHILVYTDEPERRVDLIRFGSWLNQNRG
ncbi:MAG: Na-K-Cl cotransporter, partial [Thermoanaerobaculia bacterium]|nr:Na-K-Cl cotransporter [Thermoanaerobaculia bacterium]